MREAAKHLVHIEAWGDHAGGRVTEEQPSRGTGFLVGKRHYILTAGHVVQPPSKEQWEEGSPSLSILLHDGTRLQRNATLIKLDSETDLALLRLEPGEGESPRATGLRPGDSNRLSDEQEVFVIGYPKKEGDQFPGIDSVCDATVTSPFSAAAGGLIELHVQGSLPKSFSGSPVLEGHAQVIGVVSRSFHDSYQADRGQAIPINYAAELLRIAGFNRPATLQEWLTMDDEARREGSLESRLKQIENAITALKSRWTFRGNAPQGVDGTAGLELEITCDRFVESPDAWPHKARYVATPRGNVVYPGQQEVSSHDLAKVLPQRLRFSRHNDGVDETDGFGRALCNSIAEWEREAGGAVVRDIESVSVRVQVLARSEECARLGEDAWTKDRRSCVQNHVVQPDPIPIRWALPPECHAN